MWGINFSDMFARYIVSAFIAGAVTALIVWEGAKWLWPFVKAGLLWALT